MKKPLNPEDVVEALRERIKKKDLTLTASEAVRIIWMLERLSQRCAEAYQVVGSLAGLAEVMDDPAVQKALDDVLNDGATGVAETPKAKAPHTCKWRGFCFVEETKGER